ncbi:AzlD family protein [Polycladidibacter hongkongensis]|uniref:AzlD family protein n=1 Tax=Polycladidibacter hongkongensis TaxID=1647556 RepID=UPI000831FC34|nr:AzlD domain-containing protein [Pseudovibrio hongkongensis]
MSPELFSLSPIVLLCLFGMFLSTFFARNLGQFIIRFVRISGRTEAALQAAPPAILMAVIAPVAFATGPAETAATALTALVSTRLPLLVSIILGVIAVFCFRLAFAML